MIAGMSENKRYFCQKELGKPLVAAVEKALDDHWGRLEQAGIARKELRPLSKGGHVTLKGAPHVRELRELEEDLARGVTGCLGASFTKEQPKAKLTKLFEDVLQTLDPAAGYLLDIGVGG